MTFRISRVSSDWGESTPPCEKAHLVSKVKHDFYTAHFWEIEINSLEELLQLSKDVGTSLIVDGENTTVTIYDDYIE